MKEYVVDTHSLFWYLAGAPQLSSRAQETFNEGARGDATINVLVIVLAELFFINEKFGRPLDFSAEFTRHRRGQWRRAEGQGGEGRHGPHALSAGGEQSWWVRDVGVSGDQ